MFHCTNFFYKIPLRGIYIFIYFIIILNTFSRCMDIKFTFCIILKCIKTLLIIKEVQLYGIIYARYIYSAIIYGIYLAWSDCITDSFLTKTVDSKNKANLSFAIIRTDCLNKQGIVKTVWSSMVNRFRNFESHRIALL